MDEAEGQGGGERRGINFVRRRILLRANNLEAGTASSELFIAEDTVRSSPIIRLSSRLCILDDPSIKYSLGIMGNRRKMAVVIIYIYIFSIRREKDSLDIYHNLEIRKFVRTLTFKKKKEEKSSSITRSTLNSLLYTLRFFIVLRKEGRTTQPPLLSTTCKRSGEGFWIRRGIKGRRRGGARKKIGRSNRAWEARRGEARSLVALPTKEGDSPPTFSIGAERFRARSRSLRQAWP